jgi:hypothetical protein
MTNITPLLEARERMIAALDKLESAIQAIEGLAECATCHDSGWMQVDASLVPCACLDHGLDEQRSAQGE